MWRQDCPRLSPAAGPKRHRLVDKTGEKIGSDSRREIQVYANTERVRLSVIDETTGQVLWSKIQTPINEKTSGCLSHPPFIFKDVPYSSGSYLKAEGLTAEKEEVEPMHLPESSMISKGKATVYLMPW